MVGGINPFKKSIKVMDIVFSLRLDSTMGLCLLFHQASGVSSLMHSLAVKHIFGQKSNLLHFFASETDFSTTDIPQT